MMGKKKIARRRSRSKSKATPEGQSSETQTTGDGDKMMDFGGLPHRDLKKNLGCG